MAQLALHYYQFDYDWLPDLICLRWRKDIFRNTSQLSPMGHLRCAWRVMYPLWLPHSPNSRRILE